MMWSLRRTSETPGPTSSTTPAASCPSTMGRGRVQSPLMMCQSLWQTPVAITRTRASPACGPCCSTSTTSSGVFALYRTAAFIPAPPREPMNAERPVARRKSSRIRARAKARPVGWGRLDARRARVVSSGDQPGPGRGRGARRGEGRMRVSALALKRKQWEPFAFASPSLFLISLVIVFPLGYSFYLSLRNFDLSVGLDHELLGLRNYSEALLQDGRFLGSVWNTAVIIAPALIAELLLGLGIALLLSRVSRGRPVVTALLAIPATVSLLLAAMARRMMFGVKFGAINSLGRQLGIIDAYFDSFATPALSILSVVLVEVWHNTPFMMLVLLAGLQSIPQELYQAAKADGASAWQTFWFITLPLLKFTMAVGVMIRMIDLTKIFGLIFILTYLGLALALGFFLGPFFWIVTTSLKGNEDFFAYPPVWVPSEPSLAHYGRLFTHSSGARYFTNSLVISSLSMLAALVVSLPTAYSIARWRFGGGFLSTVLLVLRMLPAIALIIPVYLMYKLLGLTNNYLGLVALYTVVYIPFAVWLLVGFLRDFPVEIEEAALIDGCSRLRALIRVVIPIIAPGLAVVALFAFIATWNEFLFAIVLTGIETKTMMVLVTSFTSGGTDTFYGEASASVVLGVLPAFAVAFFLQRYLVKGLALGGTKG